MSSNSSLPYQDPGTINRRLASQSFTRDAQAVEFEEVLSIGALDPKLSYTTVAAVAAGSSTNLDSDQVTTGKTAYLVGVLISSSVPFKAEIRTLLNGVASANKAVHFSGLDRDWNWRSPDRKFISQAQDAGAGLDGFRVVMTNLDTSDPADVYCTFFYDEG